MHVEKRRLRRVARPIEVEARTLDRLPLSGRVQISDVSAGGAFIDSLNPLPVGTRLALRFVLAERLVSVGAEVVHQMPQFGMGVRFVDLSPEATVVLGNLLQFEA